MREPARRRAMVFFPYYVPRTHTVSFEGPALGAELRRVVRVVAVGATGLSSKEQLARRSAIDAGGVACQLSGSRVHGAEAREHVVHGGRGAVAVVRRGARAGLRHRVRVEVLRVGCRRTQKLSATKTSASPKTFVASEVVLDYGSIGQTVTAKLDLLWLSGSHS